MRTKIFFSILFFILFVSCSSQENQTENSDADFTDFTTTENDKTFNENDSISEENEIEEQNDNDIVSNSNFEKPPYGINYGDTAGDFSIKTEKKEWNFLKNRTNNDSYIFVLYKSSNSNSISLWKSEITNLLELSPENVHYFFIIDSPDSAFETIKSDIDKKLSETLTIVSNENYWKNRIHISTTPLSKMNNWIKKWSQKYPSDFVFEIDRFQKIRKSGLLHSWQSQNLDLQFEFIRFLPEYFNFEFKREEELKKENNLKIISGIEGKEFKNGNIIFDSNFPTQEEMKKYNNIEIDLKQECSNPKNCEWDRILKLYLCEDEKCEKTKEIGRWITSYGRSGRWITNISSLFPLFSKGGKFRFKLEVWSDQYKNYLSFRLFNKQNQKAPTKLIPLFSGVPHFDETYNTAYKTKKIEIPSTATKVKIVAFVTGHGNGSEAENCAEFCPFDSVFSVNNQKFTKSNPDASTNRGCANKVNIGAVPNQYGSWPFGRAGWCPGMDVKLWETDISKAIKKDSENNFDLKAYLNGKDYIPKVTNPKGYRAEINTTSYLAIWE